MNNQEILNSLNEKIKAAEEALLYLKQSKAGLERVIANTVKTPAEEAWKKYWGEYPNNPNEQLWKTFQAGYNAASKGTSQEPSMINCIIEGTAPNGYGSWSQWFDEMGSKGILHNLKISSKDYKKEKEVEKLQEKEWTYKVTDEKGETNPYKQYMNSVKNLQENNWYVDAKSLVNPPTLWERFYAAQWSDSACDEFCEIVEQWLPKEQSAKGSQNVYVECTVEGFNDCLNQIKSKLRRTK